MLSREDLASPFSRRAGVTERVSVEVESGLVDPATGRSIAYAGPVSGSAILERLLAERGEPIVDGGYLTGVRRPDASQFTLELGGSLEYASPPCDSLTELVEVTRDAMALAAEVARGLGVAVLAGAILPFDPMAEVNWIPKPRVQIMRHYFASLGDPGSFADAVMGLTLSTQATVDYLDEQDLVSKLRMLAAVSPVAVALFANSPLEAGSVTGVLSRRTQFWEKIDPRRSGVPPFAVSGGRRIEDLVDWLLTVPMVYRCRDGRYEEAPHCPVGDLLGGEVSGDGSAGRSGLTMDDWISHGSQVWPHVRVRSTMELRAPDGPPYQHMPSVPAFWTGLTYHPPSRDAAFLRLGTRTLGEYQQLTRDAAVHGLNARLGAEPLGEIACDLVRLAREGLRARVDAGLEDRRVLAYLDPLDDVVASGKTFAQRCLERWEGDLDRKPARYVQAYRV
jgi:glutamate--cysteine ligase